MRQIPDVQTALGIYPWLRLLENGVGEGHHTIWLSSVQIAEVHHHSIRRLADLKSPHEMLAGVRRSAGLSDAHTMALLVDPNKVDEVSVLGNSDDDICEAILKFPLEGGEFVVYILDSSSDSTPMRHKRVVVAYPRGSQSFADQARKHEEQ